MVPAGFLPTSALPSTSASPLGSSFTLTFPGLTFRGLEAQQQRQQQWVMTSSSSNNTVPGDRTGVQMWPQRRADGRNMEAVSILTHKGEKDHKGSSVPCRLEQLATLQSPQHFLSCGLQLFHGQTRSSQSYLSGPPEGHLRAGPCLLLPQTQHHFPVSPPPPFQTQPFFHSLPRPGQPPPQPPSSSLPWSPKQDSPHQPPHRAPGSSLTPLAQQVPSPELRPLPASGSTSPEALATSPAFPGP